MGVEKEYPSHPDLTSGEETPLHSHTLKLNHALEASHTWSGITCQGTAGTDLVLGELARFTSGGLWLKANAGTASGTGGLLALVTEDILEEATGQFLLIGFFRDDSWALEEIGGWMFVHTTAGEMSETAPSSSGDQVRKVGVVITAGITWFCPDSTIVEVA